MYAEVAINAPVFQSFHYHIPPELSGRAAPGQLAQVSFGTAMQHGVIIALGETSPVSKTKPLLAILDPQPVVSAQQIALARWISERCLTPLGLCLWLMLPPGITGGRDIRVTLLDDAAQSRDAVESQVLAVLRKRGGTLTGRQLEISKALQGQQWRPAVDALAKRGALDVERILTPPRVRPRIIQTVALAIHPNQVDAAARHLGRESRRADMLEALLAVPQGAVSAPALLEASGGSRFSLDKLAAAGWVTINRETKPATVMLNISREAAADRIVELRGAQTLLKALRVLAREAEPLDVSWLYAQTGAKLEDLKRLEAEGLVILGERPSWRDSLAERQFVPTAPPTLTAEQAAAWSTIEQRMDTWGWGQAAGQRPAGLFLLHGVTGSGKTEIYLRAIAKALAQGRQAIFLVPEIALTAQTVRRVAARFPGQVAVVHSGLSEGERYDTWRRARDGLIGVVVGTRSALFTPLPDVGLIILDEEHDASYKQSEPVPPPYYHARDVAEAMMRQQNGVLILGSATPDLESIYRAERGDFTLLRLPTRIIGHRIRIQEQEEQIGRHAQYAPLPAPDAMAIDLPPVQVVDMRQELRAGNRSIFSHALQDALAETLRRREQAILYLNRRGAATYVFCRDCGYVAGCPNCDTPLTWHRSDTLLRCHRCGHQAAQPQRCPNCGSARIRYFGAGTQHIEAAVREHFPDAHILRWDADTATTPASHEIYLQRFIDHQADILIGTQMVAKGLDLPLVTLVGVVSADTGLNLPDFRAGERSFQLLTQVAGRAGRGLLGGRVILQTYEPEHYVVRAAARHDFSRFYAQEISFRRELGYPPFRRFVRIVFRDASETRARAEAEDAARLLQARLARLQMTGTEIIGPAPCFFSRENNVYRWHLALRGPDPTAALRGLEPGRGWHVDVDPVDLL